MNTNKRKGQSTLELTVALIAVFILLLGSTKIFVWVNKRMVTRQQDYEATRVISWSAYRTGRRTGSENVEEIEVDESDKSKYPRLNIFGEGE